MSDIFKVTTEDMSKFNSEPSDTTNTDEINGAINRDTQTIVLLGDSITESNSNSTGEITMFTDAIVGTGINIGKMRNTSGTTIKIQATTV